MPDTATPSVFISYSREDSAFVDRLEADLRARGFQTWVDRRRLEGGQDWQAEIDRAIDRHTVMVLVLSPNSTESSAVAHELEHANRRNMRVVPILIEKCVPHFKGADGRDLSLPVQWIQRFLNDYALGLTELLGALLSQQFSLNAPTRELYLRATDLRTSSRVADKELAAIILQHILERDPNYQEGLVKRELDQLTASLYASRAHNLRQQVLAARKTGEYGVEASALEALLALGRRDPCATEYLPIARQNSQFVDLYWVIQQQTAKGELKDARDKLQFLWSKAPYYRDPANLAPKLGLTLPRSYMEVMMQEALVNANEHRRKEFASAKSDLDQRIADENSTFQQAQELMETGYSSGFSENIATHVSSLITAVDETGTLQQETSVAILLSNRFFYERGQVYGLEVSRGKTRGEWTTLIGLIIACCYIANFVVAFPAIAIQALNPNFTVTSITSNPTLTCIGELATMVIFSALVTALFRFRKTRRSKLISEAKLRMDHAQQDSTRSLQQWQADYNVAHRQRLQQLMAEFERSQSHARAQHEQRIQEIETTYRIRPATDPLQACWEREKAV